MRVITAGIEKVIDIKKCNHRFGAKATFSHQTDSRFQTSIYAAELYGFKHNVRLGAFVTNLLGQYLEGIADVEKTGLMRHDIYFGTDYWKNPSNGKIELIPDYYNTSWTSNGAAFFNVNVGDTKNASFPNHGQQMYNISGGKFGHDLINGVKGLSKHAEMTGVIENQRSWLKSIVGRDISCGSYRNGAIQGYVEHIGSWIGMRNSVPSPSRPFVDGGDTFYGFNENGIALGKPSNLQFTRQQFMNFPSTFRWWDAWNSSGFDKQQATDWTRQLITECIADGGWYKDFCHWHSCRNNNTTSSIGEFLQIFNAARGNNFVWTCSKGEAVEYLFLRELTEKVYGIEHRGKVSILADINDKFKGQVFNGVDVSTVLKCINVPLSVEIDLSQTVLANKLVKSRYGKLINKGNNIYIAEIFFNHQEGFMINVIEEGAEGYYNISIPTATVSQSNNLLTVNSDIETRSVLFSVASNGHEYDSMPVSRNNKLSTQHIFSILPGNNYRVGLISELGNSSLIVI